VAAVGVRDLKARLSHFIERATSGEAVLVTEHGRPVAVLGPLPEGMRIADALRRAGALRWSGGKPAPSPVTTADDHPDVSGAVVEARSR
jgi:prevent-host-death family protein